MVTIFRGLGVQGKLLWSGNSQIKPKSETLQTSLHSQIGKKTGCTGCLLELTV